MSTRWIVAWDFNGRPKRTFYDFFEAEFGIAEVERIQRSVVICQDDFTARRLRALARWYGANVITFSIKNESLDDPEGDREATDFVERILSSRLSKRGRKPKLTKTH